MCRNEDISMLNKVGQYLLHALDLSNMPKGYTNQQDNMAHDAAKLLATAEGFGFWQRFFFSLWAKKG